jgi:hypothetical protein
MVACPRLGVADAKDVTMQRLKIALVRELGQDMIIVRMADSYPADGVRARSFIQQDLQHAARAAGLAGLVVPVWRANADGLMGFIAPRDLYPYFQSLDLPTVTRLSEDELIID